MPKYMTRARYIEHKALAALRQARGEKYAVVGEKRTAKGACGTCLLKGYEECGHTDLAATYSHSDADLSREMRNLGVEQPTGWKYPIPESTLAELRKSGITFDEQYRKELRNKNKAASFGVVPENNMGFGTALHEKLEETIASTPSLSELLVKSLDGQLLGDVENIYYKPLTDNASPIWPVFNYGKIDEAFRAEEPEKPADFNKSPHLQGVCTFDFEDGKGSVPAHRHVNPGGSEGGWVANTARVDPTVFVGFCAQVFCRAHVLGYASISAYARICGSAVVQDMARVGGAAVVEGEALVCDFAVVFGSAHVSGCGVVCGSARVSGNAKIGKGMIVRSVIK